MARYTSFIKGQGKLGTHVKSGVEAGIRVLLNSGEFSVRAVLEPRPDCTGELVDTVTIIAWDNRYPGSPVSIGQVKFETVRQGLA